MKYFIIILIGSIGVIAGISMMVILIKSKDFTAIGKKKKK